MMSGDSGCSHPVPLLNSSYHKVNAMAEAPLVPKQLGPGARASDEDHCGQGQGTSHVPGLRRRPGSLDRGPIDSRTLTVLKHIPSHRFRSHKSFGKI